MEPVEAIVPDVEWIDTVDYTVDPPRTANIFMLPYARKYTARTNPKPTFLFRVRNTLGLPILLIYIGLNPPDSRRL